MRYIIWRWNTVNRLGLPWVISIDMEDGNRPVFHSSHKTKKAAILTARLLAGRKGSVAVEVAR